MKPSKNSGFEIGTRVVFINPKRDSTVYVIESIVNGRIRFKGWEHHGHAYEIKNFIKENIPISPLWRALE